MPARSGIGLVNEAGTDAVSMLSARLLRGSTNQWPDYYTYSGNTRRLAPASTRRSRIFIPDRRARAARTSTRSANQRPGCVPSTVDGNQDPSSDSLQLSRRPLGHREHRQAAISKEFRLDRIRATVRIHVLLEHQPSDRNGWGNNVSLGVTNYQYEVDAHTGGLELQFADQLSASICSRAWSRTSRRTRCDTTTTITSTRAIAAGQQLHGRLAVLRRRRERTLQDRFSCAVQRADLAGTFGSPYGPRFNSRDPCADELLGQRAGLRGGRVDAADLSWKLGDLNAVVPKLTNASISDQWRPSDAGTSTQASGSKTMPTGSQTPTIRRRTFGSRPRRSEFCVNPVTRQPIFVPQPPQ